MSDQSLTGNFVVGTTFVDLRPKKKHNNIQVHVVINDYYYKLAGYPLRGKSSVKLQNVGENHQ